MFQRQIQEQMAKIKGQGTDYTVLPLHLETYPT